MSIFFDKKVPVPASAGSRIYLDIRWHSLLPLLAFVVDDDRKGSLVSIYEHLKEETIDIDADTRMGVRVTCTSWHPTEPFLAIGYETGEVVIWNHIESESFEGAKNHIGTIVVMGWSHCGTILVSTDSLGSLVVWASNVEGHIQPKASHDFKDVVSQLVFRRPSATAKVDTTERTLGRVTTWRPKTGRRDGNETSRFKSDNSSSSTRSFFVGLLNGAIFYLKDNGTSEEVLTSGSSVKFLLYHQTRDVLIVMTDASILGQFQVDSNGGLIEMNKVKISGRGDISLSWAGTGTLAIISEELSVRLIDVDTGDNFVLEPKGSSSNFAPEEYICAVDYNEKTGHLCCNTNKGKLIIWKEITSKDTLALTLMNEEDRWEWCTTTPVSPTTRISKWCPCIQDILAINALQDAFVLRQQEICATYKDKVSIVQSLATKLTVNVVNQKIRFDLESGIQIKGFTNTKKNICIWSGQDVEIYEFGKEIPNCYIHCGSFKEKSDTIYMYEKSIFVLEFHQIQMKSFQGIIKQTLTFTTEEGPPITLSGAGEYLTAATASGYLKIWHIGGREAKIHVPSRNLQSNIRNFGEIIQARNNIEGTKIGFTIAKNNLVPDSRFYIWDLGVENLISMNFPGHFVSKICWEAEDPMYIALELTVIPPEIRGSKDEEEENLQSIFEKKDPYEIEFSTNPVLLKRSEKRLKTNQKQKYLRSFENAETPSLKDLQILVSETENSRRFTRSSLSSTPPWEIMDQSESTNENNSDQESLISKFNKRSEDTEIDEGFGEPPPETPEKKLPAPPKPYKKPMIQSKRRFKVDDTPPVIEDKDTKSLNTESSLEQQSTTTTQNKIIEDESKNKDGLNRKSSVINLKSKKKFLDLAGFTRKSDGVTEIGKSEEIPANQILTLFVCSTEGILKHEKIMKEEPNDVFLGLDVPYWYSLCRTKSKDDDVLNSSYEEDQSYLSIERRTIADFKGVDEEGVHDETQQNQIKKALLSYVYHHLCGDVDKALMAMENIQSIEIWKNMARLCLSSKRVDIASICFARMKNVGACRSLRISAQKEDEIDAQVAMVALQLDLIEEAEKLLRSCGRFDILVEILIACDQWEKAVEVCENHYRIQMKTTYFLYAKYLEDEELYDEAALMYEKSGTHRTEVLRMWQQFPEKIQEYVLQMKDKQMYKWWAQYLESTGNNENALSYYELADDWYSLTRLLCYCGEVGKARHVAETINDKAACYHMGTVFNDQAQPDEAVLFYQRAGAYGPAMKICKEHGMDEMLYNISHLANSLDQLDAAKYFETRDPPDYEKAIRLYHKSGYSSKAMDIAYTTQQFGALQDVARDLLESSERKDPEMLQRCAEFFVANQQFSKALDMFASAKKYAEAMDVCVKYKIQIDEEMAERLTAPKGEEGIDAAERNQLLEKMAECCMLQGSYHLATKKFTQAGNKEKAMKVLLKSGDTDRIIHYANVSRHRDIYLMAANYLQTTDWQKSPKIVEKIVQFYTKAKMPESIVSFYEAWAQSAYEIDRNYEQSLNHLRKAERVLKDMIGVETSMGAAKTFEAKLEKIQMKIKNVHNFLTYKDLKRNPSEGIQRLRSFVKDPNLEGTVNRGDVFALIIEQLVKNGEYEAAVDVLVDMKQSISQKPGHFIQKETLEALNYALGRQAFQVENSSSAHNSERETIFPYSNSQEHQNYDYGEEENEIVEEIEVEEEEEEEEVEEEEVEYVDEIEEDVVVGLGDVNQNVDLLGRRGSLNIQQLLTSYPKSSKD